MHTHTHAHTDKQTYTQVPALKQLYVRQPRPRLAGIHLIYTKIALALHHVLVQYNDQLSHTAGYCTTHFIIWLNIVQLVRTNLLYIFNVGVIDNV